MRRASDKSTKSRAERVILIGTPYHDSTEALAIGVVDLLLESIGVVVRHPLVCVPDDVLDGGSFIPNWGHRVLANNILDFCGKEHLSVIKPFPEASQKYEPAYERVPAEAVHGPALAGPEKGQPAVVQLGLASWKERP